MRDDTLTLLLAWHMHQAVAVPQRCKILAKLARTYITKYRRNTKMWHALNNISYAYQDKQYKSLAKIMRLTTQEYENAFNTSI